MDSIQTAISMVHKKDRIPFHMPGHLGRAGGVSAMDITELPELDSLHAPSGIIRQAQEEAARLQGAQKAYYLVNGASVGVQAAILATCRENEEIILPRTMHMSVLSGLIFSGGRPVFIPVPVDPEWQIPLPFRVEDFQKAIAVSRNANACFVTYPSYHGICGDVAAVAALCQEHHLKFIADEAHGSHLGFMPGAPSSAIKAGASLSIHSYHKTMGSLTQTALLFSNDRSLPVGDCLNILQSTSPSYILMASLQETVRNWTAHGAELGAHLVCISRMVRAAIAEIDGIDVLNREGHQDLSRLVIKGRYSGKHLSDFLRSQGVYVEMTESKAVTLFITYAHTESDMMGLVEVLKKYATLPAPEEGSAMEADCFGKLHLPEAVLLPREAFLAEKKWVPLAQAVGQVVADMLVPYPPGVPILLPGERISSDAVCYLQHCLAHDRKVLGVEKDLPHLVKVVK